MIQSDGAWRSHFHFSTAACWASASATVSSTPPESVNRSSSSSSSSHFTRSMRCITCFVASHRLSLLSKLRVVANMEIWDIYKLNLFQRWCCTYQIRERDTHDKWQDILLISGSSHVSSSLCVFKIDSTRRQVSPTLKKANTDRDTLPSVNTAVCRECWCTHKRARTQEKKK